MLNQNSIPISTRLLNFSFRVIVNTICEIDDVEFEKVPQNGPLILFVNHINFLEVPVIASRIQNRPISVLAKEETWKNPALAFLFDSWNGIPIKRGVYDREAIQLSMNAISQGKILIVAPEGTRSKDGKLHQGMPGIVLLALKTKAPLLPLVYYGGEKIKNNLSRLKKTDFKITVGRKFVLNEYPETPDRNLRQQITDEIMQELAKLLPAGYRGHYSNIPDSPPLHLKYIE